MDDLSPKKTYARFCEARNFKDRWLALYKELYFYVIPNRDAFNIKFNYVDVGMPVTQELWDNTAMLAAYQRANDLHGLLLPKDRVWGKLVLDPHHYSEAIIKKNQETLDEINDRIFFYLNESNLSRVVSSSNLDLVGGTGAIWVESMSDEVPLYFRSIPAVALYIEYSTDDVVSTCWYAAKKSGRSIIEAFPDYQGDVKERLENLPNDTFMVNYGQIKTEKGYYIYAFLDDDHEDLLFERESNYQQIIVYRDRVRPGEAEGRGVGLDMLPTIKDLNRIVEYSRKSMATKAFPPMFYDAGTYFNPYAIRQWAGALIARNPQGRNPLEALQMPEHPEVIQHVLHLQDVIKKGFQVDPLGEIESPAKSATEISVRENRAQRTSATDISRLINELPKQIFDVAGKILNERGLLIKNRKQIPGWSIDKFKFDYQSPLYDIQKQEDLNHFVTNLQVKQQFWGEGAAMASVNMQEANDFLTEKLNLPVKLFPPEQIKQFMRGLMQMQKQAQLPSPAAASSPIQIQQPTGVQI